MASAPLLVPKTHSWGVWFVLDFTIVKLSGVQMRALKKPAFAISAVFFSGSGLPRFPW